MATGEADVREVGRIWGKGRIFLAIKYADQNYARLNVSLLL
ncbi:hypothetical protein ACFQ4Y_00375 [Kroppenstedtia sanguinis]|uniref:Uncharacterized protein n=1 Tax=Kroppenstedtia sanguinis TaxID=1380684 RepID=A0ABW4C5E6_9BACL